MSEEEIEINEAHAELRTLRADLAALHAWADRVLDRDHTDRQYIAEHLSAAVAALSANEPMPARPYDDTDEF
jgi:hypothetical protein